MRNKKTNYINITVFLLQSGGRVWNSLSTVLRKMFVSFFTFFWVRSSQRGPNGISGVHYLFFFFFQRPHDVTQSRGPRSSHFLLLSLLVTIYFADFLLLSSSATVSYRLSVIDFLSLLSSYQNCFLSVSFCSLSFFF